MNFSTETIGRLLASGRNYASTIVGFIGGVGLMSASQSKGLTDAINEMINGLSMIVHGATSAWQILCVAFPIIGIALAKWASRSAKTENQAASVNASVKEAIADPTKQVSMAVKASVIDTAAVLPEVKDNTPIIKVGDPVLASAVPAPNVVAR